MRHTSDEHLTVTPGLEITEADCSGFGPCARRM